MIVVKAYVGPTIFSEKLIKKLCTVCHNVSKWLSFDLNSVFLCPRLVANHDQSEQIFNMLTGAREVDTYTLNGMCETKCNKLGCYICACT